MGSEAAYFPDALVHAEPERGEKLAAEKSTAASNQGDSAATDEQLLRQVGLGSKAALGLLFHRYQRAVLSVAWRILKDRSEAEDLRQEVFLLLFQKAKLFDASKGNASSWIIKIAYRRAINRRRYLSHRHHYLAHELDEERVGGQRPLFMDEIGARNLLNRLHEQLSKEQSQTLELHFFEGYSLREIAEKTNQTLGNVRHHYYRGLERLRSVVFSERCPSERIGRK